MKSPEYVVVENRSTSQLLATLRHLPPSQRVVVSLHLEADLQPSEIASTLGITANAARVNLHRAITQLRTLLARDGIDLPFDEIQPLQGEG